MQRFGLFVQFPGVVGVRMGFDRGCTYYIRILADLGGLQNKPDLFCSPSSPLGVQWYVTLEY